MRQSHIIITFIGFIYLPKQFKISGTLLFSSSVLIKSIGFFKQYAQYKFYIYCYYIIYYNSCVESTVLLISVHSAGRFRFLFLIYFLFPFTSTCKLVVDKADDGIKLIFHASKDNFKFV